MPYNFVADGFHTKKLCSRLFSSEVRFCTENCFFEHHLWWGGGLGATYHVHLRLIGKRVVDFVVLIELFLLVAIAEATSEYRLKFDDLAPTGAG